MSTLPEPHFVDRDGKAILAETIARFEALTGRPLSPAQVERVLIDLMAYRETLVRIAIQETAKQNLVAYALYPMVDYLAALVGAQRLAATPAATTLVFSLPAPLGVPSVVPAGYRVASKDGKVEFLTLEDLTIETGDTEGSVVALCSQPGPIGNGYGLGQISQPIGSLTFAFAVANTTDSSGGLAAEDTERLRARIPVVAAGSSVAGPSVAYERLARSAHQSVLSAYVDSPGDGIVRVTVLSDADEESPELLELVEAACSAEAVRPLSDTVEAVGTERVVYSISYELQIYKGQVPEDVAARAQDSLVAYTSAIGRVHGRAPTLGDVLGALKVPGVRSAHSAETWPQAIGRNQTARCGLHLLSGLELSKEPQP